MKKIEESLQRLFRRHRLIFWYDEEGSMQEIFDALELQDVKKLTLDGNPFGLKYKMLRLEPTTSFLIYAPHPRPSDEENWLLDLELSHHIFSADKASLLLQELGLPLQFKPTIERYLSFFNSTKRTQKLRELLQEPKSEEDLLLGMCATLLGCEAIWEEVLQTLFAQKATDGKKLEQLEKFGLMEWIYDQAKHRYGYESDTPTYEDLLTKMLLSHFYFKTDPQKMPLHKEAALFISRWMDSSKNRNHFATLSEDIAQKIGIEKVLEPYGIEQLSQSDTFEAIDQKIVSQIKAMLLSQSCPCEEIETIVRTRRTRFWYTHFYNLYEALLHAANFRALHQRFEPLITSPVNGIEHYTTSWHTIDLHYRKFLLHYKQAKDQTPLKELLAFIEERYIVYLRELGDEWQKSLQRLKKWRIDGVRMQRDFYKELIEPMVEQNKKIFVLICDALRYEAGVELAQKLSAINRLEVQNEEMIGALPSYTQLGIASLLPHKTLSFDAKDGTVYVDHQRSDGAKNRDKILKKYHENSVYIDAEDLLAMSIEEGRRFVKAHQIFYIYHNDIDATGDKAASESNVFMAVEMAFEKIEKILKHIFNCNGTHVLITADHGFLYHETEVQDPDRCEMPRSGTIYKSNRRFIIGKNLPQTPCAAKFTAQELEFDDDVEVLSPRSINRFRVQGAGSRFVHGGATLQEVVVPLIRCTKKRKDDECTVEVHLIKSFSRITSNSVALSLIQDRSVDAKCKKRTLKMAFYAKDGTLLSDIQKAIFDKRGEDMRDLEQKFTFEFNAAASRYNGEIVYLRMFEPVAGTSMERLYKEEPFEMHIAFSNDFEEF